MWLYIFAWLYVVCHLPVGLPAFIMSVCSCPCNIISVGRLLHTVVPYSIMSSTITADPALDLCGASFLLGFGMVSC